MKKIILSTLMLLLSAGLWAAKAPTDEQLKAFCREAGAAFIGCETQEARQKAFDGVVTKFSATADISLLTAQQVALLFENGGITLDPMLRRWLEPTFTKRAKAEPVFAFYLWKYMPENDGFMHGTKETAALVAFLATKDLQNTIDANNFIVNDIFAAMPTMKDANWHTDGFADGMLRLMKCNIPEKTVMECVKVFNSIARVDTIDGGLREQFRTICRDKYATLASTLDIPRKIKACNEQIKYLDGPFACGTLVGSKAPELHFMQTPLQTSPRGGSKLLAKFTENGENGITRYNVKKLSDFYLSPTGESEGGPVIMLDFWGTKCVPCLQSFPEIAEMQAHFEGKDVVILGVTSLQGYFIDTPNKRTIQCRNDKEKELSLFPDYMKGMGITWTIAISEEDVMNTDYGALAIPHVVIIDKHGIVRHNAVNGDKETKIKLIEKYLNE